MTTISAVELRKNLGAIMKRVDAGEDIQVTYRHNATIRLTSDKPHLSGRMPGLDAFLKAPRKKSTLDVNKSYKELYHEHLEDKYGKYVH